MIFNLIGPRRNRSACLILTAMLAGVSLLTGCTIGDAVVNTTIRAANQADAARMRSRGNTLLSKHLKMIDELRAKGDPLGDYLWVVANSNDWVDNAEHDAEKLFDMYQAAAGKGSNDALVAMGVMLFSGMPVPNPVGGKKGGPYPREKMDMKKGLELIEQGTRDRCFYWEPVIQTITSHNCLRPVIAANKVWPKFRDGFLWPKDETLMNYWKAKRDRCEQDLGYRQAYARCN